MIFILPINHTVFLIALILLNQIIYKFTGNDKYLYKKDFQNPPSNMNPAEAIYTLTGDVDNKSVISLLYFWAQEGYLKLVEQENEVLFIKVKDLPIEAKKYENNFFNTIFNHYGDGQRVSTKDLQGKLFGIVYRTQGYIKKQINRQDKNSSFQRFLILSISTVFSTLPYMLYFNHIGLVITSNTSFNNLTISFFLGLVFALPNSFYSFTIKKWLQYHPESNISNTVWSVIMFLCITLILGFIGDIAGISKLELLILSIFVIILTFQLGLIRRKVPTMHRLYNHIQGFRNFLSSITKEDATNSQLFYRHISYALTFNSTYQWSINFNGIVTETPLWYQGYSKTPYKPQEFALHLENQLKNITLNTTSPPIPKGSVMIEAQQ